MNVIITSLIIVMHFSPPELSIPSYFCYSILSFSNNNNKKVTLLLGNLSNIVCSPPLSAFFCPPSGVLIIIVIFLKVFSPFMAAIIIGLLSSYYRHYWIQWWETTICSSFHRIENWRVLMRHLYAFREIVSLLEVIFPKKAFNIWQPSPSNLPHLLDPYHNPFLSRSRFMTGI